MAKAQRVLIVGGGVGGLSTAIALARRGIAAEIVEIQDGWVVYGVGIIQTPNAIRAYERLGIGQKCIEAGFLFHALKQFDSAGKLLHSVELGQSEGGGTCGILRPRLRDVLVEEALALGTPARFGVTVQALEDRGAEVEVRFTDGTSGAYDLVVGADGMHSQMRQLLFPNAPVPRYMGQGCWRVTAPRPMELDYMCQFAGPNKAGFVPLSAETMYMFVTTTEPGNPRLPPESLHELLRERLHGHTSKVVSAVRDNLTDPEAVVYRPLYSLLLPAPWYKGRVVLIGDAAHAMTPHHGQGAGMAAEDAVVLGEELAANAGVEAALQAFMQRRFERCKVVVEASAQVCRWEVEEIPTLLADRAALGESVRRTLAQPL